MTDGEMIWDDGRTTRLGEPEHDERLEMLSRAFAEAAVAIHRRRDPKVAWQVVEKTGRAHEHPSQPAVDA